MAMRSAPPQSGEVLLASPIQTTADSGTAATATITLDESGWIDLSRGMLLVASDAALANAALDYGRFVPLKTFSRNNKDQLLRGTAGFSPNFFYTGRANNVVGFPAIYVETRTTFELTIDYTYTGGAGAMSAGFPFIPDDYAYEAPLVNPGQWGQMEISAGSPKVSIANAAAGTITITFSDDGVIDLDRLIITGIIPPTASQQPIDAAELVKLCTVRSIQLRRDRPLVSGAGSAVDYPAAIFAPWRERNWVRLGQFKVKNGDALTISVFNNCGTDSVQWSASVPQLLMDWQSSVAKKPLAAPCAPCG